MLDVEAVSLPSEAQERRGTRQPCVFNAYKSLKVI